MEYATDHCHSAIIGDSSAVLGDGKRFVVRADEKLTRFMEMESAIHGRSPSAALQRRGNRC
jgi:hypothetical protein